MDGTSTLKAFGGALVLGVVFVHGIYFQHQPLHDSWRISGWGAQQDAAADQMRN